MPGVPAAELVGSLLAGAGGPDGIVDLNVGGVFGGDVTGSWEAPLALTFALLQACHESWLTETLCNRHFFVAVTRTDGQMGFGAGPIAQPLGGLWAGLAKGLPRELPNCNVKVVDLAADVAADPARAAAVVCAELYRWGLFEVAHRDGRRYTLTATARSTPAPRISLGPGDTVLMSGGGRGIGFALALDLATSLGCRVVVSGRGPAPDADDPLLEMPETDFRRYRDQLLREAAANRRLPAARARLAQLARDRTVHRNLAGAARAGADIRYVACDITDPADVHRLVQQSGGAPAAVIHNAGIDVPARLPDKGWDTVRQVVRVKIEGLLNLLSALPRETPPRVVCAVGSLTGRWGGMVGQLDYGAANEGLSRLGLWADRRDELGGAPVTTVAWPTWDRLGMITNYQATLRYMSAMDVADGVARWTSELLAAEGGEVTFIGDVGPAVVPGLLRGYPAGAELPGIDRLRSTLAYLGEPLEFRPFQAITSRVVLDLATIPAAGDVTIDGRRALPVSVCLEHLLAAADWVRPDTPDSVVLDELRDVDVVLAELAPPTGHLTLTQSAVGAWHGPVWRVAVALTSGDRPVANAVVGYRAAMQPGGRPPEQASTRLVADACPSRDGAVAEPSPSRPTADGMRWDGHVFELARWCRHRDGRWHAELAPDRPEDLFLSAAARPTATLGFTAVENLVRATALATGAAADPAGGGARLRIARIAIRNAGDERSADGALLFGSPYLEPAAREAGADGDRWTVGDTAMPRISATGIAFTPDNRPASPPHPPPPPPQPRPQSQPESTTS